MNKIMVISALVIGIMVCATAQAQIISHVPNDMVPPVVKTPAWDPLVPGGAVGAAGINFGVDYTFGGIEGIFDNGGGDEGAIGGINGSNILDLLTAVDGAIVVAGTTDPGVTSYLSVEAGFAADGSLLLEVFGTDGVLITSVVNGPPAGPHGRTTMTIDRGGIFDIAFFKVSTPGVDTFGVDQVDLETPLPAGGIVVDLIADGGSADTAFDVGQVTIENDGTNLVVTFTLDLAPWGLWETHLHIGDEVADIPKTKKGNAIPGKFDYDDSDAAVSPTEHVYTIPLADLGLDAGDDIVVAAHAAIAYVDDMGTPDPADDILYEETAWGEGEEIAEGRDWAMYIEAEVPEGPAIP